MTIDTAHEPNRPSFRLMLASGLSGLAAVILFGGAVGADHKTQVGYMAGALGMGVVSAGLTIIARCKAHRYDAALAL